MNKDEKIQKLEEENNKLKEQLNKYLLKNKTYKPTPEQRKEYNKREYLKRKEKIKKENEEKTIMKTFSIINS